MDEEPIACPNLPLLERILAGRAAPDRGEALARHVENCPECAARAAMIRLNPPPLPSRPLNRPWRAYFTFAAVLVILFAAIYCVLEQVHRGPK